MAINPDAAWMVSMMDSLRGTLWYSQDQDKRTNIEGGYCDCSGLAWWLYRKRGYNIGSWTGSQISDGELVKSGGGGQSCSADGMQPGDLVLFDWRSTSYTTWGHVEMYMGDGLICGHGGVPDPGPSVKSLAQQTSYANVWQVRRILSGGGVVVPSAEGYIENGLWTGLFYTTKGDRVEVKRGFITHIEFGVIDVVPDVADIISSNAYLSQAEMQQNAAYILKYLTARGWTRNAVCAMLGNMQSESTINPGIWESLIAGNYAGGYGLVQWTPASKYTNWAAASGYDIGDINGQLERIIMEKENGEQWIPTYTYPMSFYDFSKSSASPYTLALAFLACYERPANPNQPIRGEQAEYWNSVL